MMKKEEFNSVEKEVFLLNWREIKCVIVRHGVKGFLREQLSHGYTASEAVLRCSSAVLRHQGKVSQTALRIAPIPKSLSLMPRH